MFFTSRCIRANPLIRYGILNFTIEYIKYCGDLCGNEQHMLPDRNRFNSTYITYMDNNINATGTCLLPRNNAFEDAHLGDLTCISRLYQLPIVSVTRGPFCQYRLSFSAGIRNRIHYNMWDEITYQFQTSTVGPLKIHSTTDYLSMLGSKSNHVSKWNPVQRSNGKYRLIGTANPMMKLRRLISRLLMAWWCEIYFDT